MATGDAAAAAGMDLVIGTQAANLIDDEINKTRDYIADRAPLVQPVTKGGTGATSAEEARSNLGIVLTTTSGDAGGKVPVYTAAGQIAAGTPTSAGHAANKAYVDAAIAALRAELT